MWCSEIKQLYSTRKRWISVLEEVPDESSLAFE
jgi:hypothetical protein